MSWHKNSLKVTYVLAFLGNPCLGISHVAVKMKNKEQIRIGRATKLLRLNINLRKFLNRIEVDRAVIFGILARTWGLFAGAMTFFIIAVCFTAELQGYYFSFGSILALQFFAQLGLGTIIIQFASHEWAKLKFDKAGMIVGDKNALSRLVSLAGIASRWFLIVGVITTACLCIGGYVFFSQKSDPTVSWVAPWMTLSLLTGISILMVPIWSLLEGCNQVTNVYYFRFMEGICSTLSAWVAILFGAKLWTACVVSGVILLYSYYFLMRRYKQFLKLLFFTRPVGPKIKWKKEIIPMQWRFALSSIAGYCVGAMFTPVVFYYHGAIAAGQMGMTWSLISALSSIPNIWIAPKIPFFGILIAQKKYQELDALFWRLTIIVTIISCIGSAALWALVQILNVSGNPLSNRLLSPLPTALFLSATVILAVSFPFSGYVLAHKKHPMYFLDVLSGILVGISNLLAGKHFGIIGIVAGLLAVRSLLFPFRMFIWYRCREKWHRDTGV
jgi:O-antigen/teichoic acid export membrane protein